MNLTRNKLLAGTSKKFALRLALYRFRKVYSSQELFKESGLRVHHKVLRNVELKP